MVAVIKVARQLGGQVKKITRIVSEGGPMALAQRLAKVAYDRLGVAALDQSLTDSTVADSTRLALEVPARGPERTRPLQVGWVISPPSAGSGGHTTLFRMVEAVEGAGHHCHLFLYDRYGGNLADHEIVIRSWWPGMQAEVHDARAGMGGMDACVASSWETAHVLATVGTMPMRRLYFIQDFEPFFYARGSNYSLAEDTYRFGFRNIALGQMVANLLRSEIGIEPDTTEFGCDNSVYHLLPERPRSGVVWYARPDVPRRGYLLARLALQRFHRQHPEVEIHVFGSTVRDLPFPTTQHGRLSPAELNELYNSSIAGLAMSFTNISLVAEEMLAAGTIAVVNDSPHAHADLDNPEVIWAKPTPQALADALSSAVDCPDGAERARSAADSVRRFGWSKAKADVLRIIADEVFRA